MLGFPRLPSALDFVFTLILRLERGIGLAAVAPMRSLPICMRIISAAVAMVVVVTACWTETSEEPTPPRATVLGREATPKEGPVVDLGENAQLAKRGGVLVLANRGDPPAGFDPMRTSSIALHHPGGAIFGPGNLVTRCRQNIYLVCPNLATDWIASPDFKEWTFT